MMILFLPGTFSTVLGFLVFFSPLSQYRFSSTNIETKAITFSSCVKCVWEKDTKSSGLGKKYRGESYFLNSWCFRIYWFKSSQKLWFKKRH